LAKKNKVYAVRAGHQTGLFYNWKDCENAIKGFSKADYKGFPNEQEANNYLNKDINSNDIDITSKAFFVVLDGFEKGLFDNWARCQKSISGFSNPKYKQFTDYSKAVKAWETKNLDILNDEIYAKMNEYDYAVFTDGGADVNSTKIGAWGIIIIDNVFNQEIEFSKGFKKTTNNRMEMMATHEAFLYFLRENIENKKIGFFIDSEFTIKTIEGEYKITKNPILGEKLLSSYKDLSLLNHIELNHVNSHVGIDYNEKVDKLLNQAKKSKYLSIDEEYESIS